jgi:hypothetical protein
MTPDLATPTRRPLAARERTVRLLSTKHDARWSRVCRPALIGWVAAIVVLLATPVASASIWTAVNSGTTDDISALAYIGPGRLVFVTSSGKAFRRTPGGFAQGAGIAAGTIFTDLAFAPDGVNGVAVGDSGAIYHSTDGGANWSRVDAGTFPTTGSCTDIGTVTAVPVTNYNLDSVTFASPTTVYVTGAGGIILKSTTGGAAFGEVDHRANGSCKVGGVFTQDLGDSQWINDQTGYVVADYFGTTYVVTDGLAANTAAQRGAAVGDFYHRVQVALDRVKGNRLWAVSPGDAFGPYASTNGGQSWGVLDTVDELGRSCAACHYWADVATAGGTVVAVGDSGAIGTSIDGQRFFLQRAAGSGPTFTEKWTAVDLYDASHAAVGGAGGQLAVTDAANTVPDFTPPTGLIVGPASGQPGQALTFTANVADEQGGSGIDPNGFSWTSEATPGATGSSATFAFATPGSYLVHLSFRDMAGNKAEATKEVSITSPSARRSRTRRPTFSFTGSGAQLSAKRVGSKIRVTIKGRVRPPAGVSRARACKGTVQLTITTGRKLLAARGATLKPSCRFSKTVVLSRSKVGKSTKLGLTVRFRGNAVMGARMTNFTVRVTR